jgi:tetratricopeptide (TPR) repeat protein
MILWRKRFMLRTSCVGRAFGSGRLGAMFFRHRSNSLVFASALLFVALCAPLARAQVEASSEDEADPVKLFERGQQAHARGDFVAALTSYDEALKLRPEFPEAEFQKGAALVSLKRWPEAERAFRRAMELRSNWALPRAALGDLLARTGRDREAEPLLRRALELDPKLQVALATLAEIRLRAKAPGEAVELLRRATAEEDAPASTWALRGIAERAAGNQPEAAASLDRALDLNPNNVAALAERAALRADARDFARAIEDLQKALGLAPQAASIRLQLASVYAQAGRRDEARQALDALDPAAKDSPAAIALRSMLTGDCTADETARAALEKALEGEPRNATLLAQLGNCYRTVDPQRSLAYYRRAAEIEPRNADYATGYAAALVQARRFTEAVAILRRVIASAPEHYAAHANLATALYETKQFPEAISEYKWILRARPEVTIAYYFIATAHDKLGEFEDALAAYETFLAQADTQKNRLEIEKVNLRLPTLRNQIKRGEGVKKEK